MKKRALWKDFFMEIRKSFTRFLSIFLIVALGVAFFAGLWATNSDMRLTADSYFDKSRLMDIRILSPMGLTEEDIRSIAEVSSVEMVEPTYSTPVLCDVKDNELVLEVLSLTSNLNLFNVDEGRLPEKEGEVFVDRFFIQSTDYNIGDRISILSGTERPLSETLKHEELTIVGIGSSSYYLSFQRGASVIGNGDVNSFIVVLPSEFNLPVYTSAYASVKGAREERVYTEAYDELVEETVKQIKEQNPSWYVLDRSSIEAYVEFEQNADRIGAIGEVFPLIFFLVAALISLTTMTRMVEEERIQIGTLKALGYSKISIARKYILYALFATLGGSICGALIGLKLLPTVIITAYKIMYTGIPEVIAPFNLYYALLATILAVFCVELATFLACYKELFTRPAQLMRPAAPKAGKRVLLERVTIIWNKLNFTWKSTIRNLFRYKTRFFMTVFGIGGCMALLLVGFGLKDSIFVIYTRQFDEIMHYDASISIDRMATKSQMDDLKKELIDNPGIKSATLISNTYADISKGKKTKGVTVYIPEDKLEFGEYIMLRNRIGHDRHVLEDEGVILTEQAAKSLGVLAGDYISMKIGDKIAEVKVSAVTENYLAHYLYMTPELYERSFGQKAEYNEYLLMIEGENEELQSKVGNSLLKLPAANSIFYTSHYQNLLSNVLVSLNIVIWVLIIAAGLLAFVVLYNLNNININERRRELATIKVLGFYNYELASYVYRENILLTIIGAVFGVLFGIILHRYVITTVEIDLVMFGRNIDLSSYIYSILLTFLFSGLVNFTMYFKLRKINMVESLKSVE